LVEVAKTGRQSQDPLTHCERQRRYREGELPAAVRKRRGGFSLPRGDYVGQVVDQYGYLPLPFEGAPEALAPRCDPTRRQRTRGGDPAGKTAGPRARPREQRRSIVERIRRVVQVVLGDLIDASGYEIGVQPPLLVGGLFEQHPRSREVIEQIGDDEPDPSAARAIKLGRAVETTDLSVQMVVHGPVGG
jgi:hypothetical protein